MTPEQINIECALVDGFQWMTTDHDLYPKMLRIPTGLNWKPCDKPEKPDAAACACIPNYLEYNAIIPLIQRQDSETKETMWNEYLWTVPTCCCAFDFIPLQLATALLKALGRWKE